MINIVHGQLHYGINYSIRSVSGDSNFKRLQNGGTDDWQSFLLPSR